LKPSPLVSVCIASYNHEKYIGETITSVIAQSYANWELIVVDDRSSDRSLEILRYIAGQYPNQIKLIELTENLGPSGALNKASLEISASPVTAAQLGGLLSRISDNTISGKIAKQIFDALWHGEGNNADSIIEEKGLKQVTDSGAIEAIVDEVIANNSDQVAQYRAGKEQLLGFFVGQVMKASKGKANPAQVNDILKTKLAG